MLRPDDEPALYLVEQSFSGPDGARAHAARLRLPPAPRGVLRARRAAPRKDARRRPSVDRLELLRATHANLSQIFLLYADPANEVGRALAAAAPPPAPALEAPDGDGNPCRLRPVTGPVVDQVVALLAGRQVLIADGHHRYETALAYRAERRAAGDKSADWVMVCLSSMDDPGLAVFPTHRLLKGVARAEGGRGRRAPARRLHDRRAGRRRARDCAPAMERVGRSTGPRKALGLYFAARAALRHVSSCAMRRSSSGLSRAASRRPRPGCRSRCWPSSSFATRSGSTPIASRATSTSPRASTTPGLPRGRRLRPRRLPRRPPRWTRCARRRARRDHAAEVDLLLPEAPHRARLQRPVAARRRPRRRSPPTSRALVATPRAIVPCDVTRHRAGRATLAVRHGGKWRRRRLHGGGAVSVTPRSLDRSRTSSWRRRRSASRRRCSPVKRTGSNEANLGVPTNIGDL